MTGFDPRAWRRHYPIFDHPVDGRPLHYLDNAATGQMPRAVLEAVIAHETTARANVKRSVHRLAEKATLAYEGARETVANFLGVDDDEIVFTGGCTAAINLVAHGWGNRLGPGDEIVVGRGEHHANLVPWQMLAARRAARLVPLELDDDGRITGAAIAAAIGPRTRLVAVTHASNVTGAISPLAEIVAAARAVGAPVLVDGAQMAPHGPLDLPALGIDFYALSGHKLGAPNGIGVLWGRADRLAEMPPFLGGGEMIRTVTFESASYAAPPQRFEAGTPPIAQAVGLGAACRFLESLDHEGAEAHLARLTGRLIAGLSRLDGNRGRLRLLGPSGLDRRLPVVSFAIDGVHPHDLSQLMDRHGVAIRGGHHCAQPLMTRFGVQGSSRASLAPFNDDDDIDICLTALAEALKLLAP